MPHSCRTHCPSRSRFPWLFDLLATLALLTGLYWAAGKVAPVVDAGMSRVALAVGVVAALVVVAVAVKVAVTAWLNRRARARYKAIEREAWAEPVEPVEGEPAALPSPPRELEAAPIRVEAFRVEGQCVAERDAA